MAMRRRIRALLGLTLLVVSNLTYAFDHARILWPELDCELNGSKYGATARSVCNGHLLATYSDWHEVYMRWSLEELTVGTTMGATGFNAPATTNAIGGNGHGTNRNWGNVTKAVLRLHTHSATGKIHMYVQHLNDTAWGNDGGVGLKWHTRPRSGQIFSSFNSYTGLSNQIDVTEQVQYMMTMPTRAQKKFAIRIFQEGQTMVHGSAGVWQRFNSLESDDFRTRPWLEVTTDCAGCIGNLENMNTGAGGDDVYEGIDGVDQNSLGTPLDFPAPGILRTNG